MNINKHRLLMLQLLKDIFQNELLSFCLALKGGTCLMFFRGLQRFVYIQKY